MPSESNDTQGFLDCLAQWLFFAFKSAEFCGGSDSYILVKTLNLTIEEMTWAQISFTGLGRMTRLDETPSLGSEWPYCHAAPALREVSTKQRLDSGALYGVVE